MEKQRSEGVVSGEAARGRGAWAHASSSTISSVRGTISRAVSALVGNMGSRFLAAAIMVFFVKNAAECLAHPQLSEILVTDRHSSVQLDGSLVRRS